MRKLTYLFAVALMCMCYPAEYDAVIDAEILPAVVEEVALEKEEVTNEVKETETPTPSPTTEPVVAEVKTNNEIPLGVCKLSAYCKENYPHICNNGDSTYTATGTTPTVGRTVAVDPSMIPYGSQVIINGHTYIAEDCGGSIKGNRIDILFETHQEALNFGIQYAEVSYIPKECF